MIKKITALVLLACMVAMPAVLLPAKALAYDADLNLRYEVEEGLSQFTYTDGVSIEGETAVDVAYDDYDVPACTWTFIPGENGMAMLSPTGEDPYSMDDLQSEMLLSDKSMEYVTEVFPEIYNVAYLYRDIELSAGQQMTIYWNYLATDYDPWNDGSLLCAANLDNPSQFPILNGYYGDVTILGATVLGTGNYSTGDYGSTGWQAATIKAALAGTYRVGFIAFNLEDDALSPYLFVDDQPGFTLKNGTLFDAIEPDDNPPPAQSVCSLNYDISVFHEADSNDGSVTETATLTLRNDTFAGEDGEPISDVAFENTPAGLTPVVTKTGADTAVLSFTGKADDHGKGSDISNFRVTFGDGAFSGEDASAVLGADTSMLGFDFFETKFTVNFYDAEGGLLSTQKVEDGNDAVPPTPPYRPGYSFDAWSDSWEGIADNLDLSALYTADTDTPYAVEYYAPKTDGSGYALIEKAELTGTTDSQVTAEVLDIEGLQLDESKSVLKGVVAGDGSLVLAVYYKEAAVPDTGDAQNPYAFWMILSLAALAALGGYGRMTRKGAAR